jgi:sRNA-binding regulator protein Hfq
LSNQGEFSFTQPSASDGYSGWITARDVAAKDLARRLNLPIGHEVELWLFGGIKLRGKLHLRDEFLLLPEDRVRHLELVIDHATFLSRDVESCIRLD